MSMPTKEFETSISDLEMPKNPEIIVIENAQPKKRNDEIFKLVKITEVEADLLPEERNRCVSG